MSAHGEVVMAAAGGDDEALTALVREYHDRVYRFGLRVCRDEFDADDAVQEAFTKLAKRRDVMGDAGALSWLMSVVRNTCRRMLRPFLRSRPTLGARASGEGAEPEADALDPAAVLERWELVQRVHACIAALERPYREVLILRDLEGLSGQETCERLGLELAAMKTRLHRARALLRAELVAHGVSAAK